MNVVLAEENGTSGWYTQAHGGKKGAFTAKHHVLPGQESTRLQVLRARGVGGGRERGGGGGEGRERRCSLTDGGHNNIRSSTSGCKDHRLNE